MGLEYFTNATKLVYRFYIELMPESSSEYLSI